MIISFLILYITEIITIKYIYLYRISDIYIPLAIGIFLIYRYGPIILISMYLSTFLTSYFYWGHPIYASPAFGSFNAFFLFLSWFFYVRLLKGDPSLPNLPSVSKYLIFGIALPLILYLIYMNILLITFINFKPDPFWIRIYKGFVGDLMAIIVISFLLLYFFYDCKFEKGMLFPHLSNKIKIIRREFFTALVLFIAIIIPFTLYFEFTSYWYIYGLLLLAFSLRYGFGISIISNLIIFVIVYLLPAVFSSQLSPDQIGEDYIIEIFYGLSFLSVFSLILGRSIGDKKELLVTEKKLVNDLRDTNKSLTIARKYFARIFESNPNLIAIIRDRDGAILNLNSEGFNMLHLNPSDKDPIRINVWDIMSGENWNNICDCPDLETKHFEFDIKRNQLPPILCEVTVRRFTVDHEIHYLINATDVTEKRAAEEQLHKANQEKIELNKRIIEFKMMALRSAMSPHFIFNCLNSIQFFILKNNKKEAVYYLSIFSKLVRNVLDISTKSMVTLATEIEIIKYYVALEQMRFENKFDVAFDIDPEVDPEDTEIPPLLLQPYVENAIIHGLSHKQDKGLLEISVKKVEERLKCSIRDNGVGREYTQIMKSKKPSVLMYKSKGMAMTKERLELLNRDEKEGVNIIDLKDEKNKPMGTQVDIFIAVD